MTDPRPWPDIRVRRATGRRRLFWHRPTFEVDVAGTDGSERHRTEDPRGTLTALGLEHVDATDLIGRSTAAWDGGEGDWIGLPEGRRRSPRDIPRIRVRRLPDEGRRAHYEVQVDEGPVEHHDDASFWARVRAGAHPADYSAPMQTMKTLFARGDHTTWVDYVTGGTVTEAP